jgi:predicted type IV restriction endonuclease
MPAPKIILTLIQNFERNIDSYRSGKYNETQVRRDFIDPMFKALGWDMDNSAGLAEAYRDVIHEDAIKIGESTRAPDYSFRVGGQRKFFLEAKKPAVNVKDAIEPAFQLRRYAWSAKLPLSIVTDFEEFAVYDCRQKPDKNDKASKARLFYCTFRDYAEKWDEIAAIFSKTAVQSGSFDRYASTVKGKRGTTEVDSAFLAEIEGWRDLLARNIALRNASLTQRELNFAVQQTIDRIIFLRICEDRGIERYGRLKELQQGVNAYGRLRGLFREADDRYNSGLFHFKREKGRAEAPDELTLNLEIDDKPLKEIFKNLYYPDCPYEFSVLGADILGSVYEQFLGKVIRLTAGNRAVVEDKPEVKKAGGVFYTPAYIVQYIVQHTVGKLLEGKSAKEAAGISILDPACGSGSFLIVAYQYLLDWYLARYVEEGVGKYSKGKEARLRNSASGEWRLTTSEKKRILLEHIYGVDIDTQAVEVTKLSLLLKVLEGESDQTLNSQMKLFHERALPDLDRNIQCGNSLIGPDFYDGQVDLDDEASQRINVFDWQAAFPHIFQSPTTSPRSKGAKLPLPLKRGGGRSGGGFHVVIGNPPYRRELDYKELMDEIASTDFGRRYRSPRMDLWYYFVHRGLQVLRPKGLLSFIVNAYWVAGTGSEKLISELASQAHVDEIFFFGKLKIFQAVSGQHMIIRIANLKTTAPTRVRLAMPETERTAEPFVAGRSKVVDVLKEQAELFLDGKIDIHPSSDGLLKKLNNWPQLDTFGVVRQGIAENPASINKKTNEKYGNKWKVGQGVFVLTRNEVKALNLPATERCLLRPYHDLRDLGRYSFSLNPSSSLIYSTKNTCPDIADFPMIRAHLSNFRSVTEIRRETLKGSNSWWHLHWPRDEDVWSAPKVMSIQMSARPSFVSSAHAAYVPFSVNVFVPKTGASEHLNYFTALLNSRLMWEWFKHHAKRRGVGLEINGHVLKRAPIRSIDLSKPTDKSSHDQIVRLVDKMLSLTQQLAAAKTPQDTNLVQRQIDATDKQIDQLVYALYGLTDEEIALVERV